MKAPNKKLLQSKCLYILPIKNAKKLQIDWRRSCRRNRPKSRADSDVRCVGLVRRWARKLPSRLTRPERRERDSIEICRRRVWLGFARGQGPARRPSRLAPARTKLRDFGELPLPRRMDSRKTLKNIWNLKDEELSWLHECSGGRGVQG